MGIQLLIVNSQLSIVNSPLSIVNSQLSIVNCQLFVSLHVGHRNIMNRKRLSPAPWQPSYERGAHAKRLNALYKRLHALLLHRRRYRSVTCTAAELARELDVAAGDISEAVTAHTGMNFSRLLSELRVDDACRLLDNPACDRYTTEEIGLMTGFSSRQVFYKTFKQQKNTTPLRYRQSRASRLATATENKS